MASVGNNVNGKIAHVRDSYFDSGEKEYLEQLLKDPKQKALHEKLLRQDAEKLYEKAAELMTRVELGEFNEKQMAEAEYMITHLLGAIEDLERVLELTKTMDGRNKKPDNVKYNMNKYSDEQELSM